MKQNRIAVTGGIGSGKSVVSKYLRGKGYFVADCDEIGKNVSKNQDVLQRIRELFGAEFVVEGKLNRKDLGAFVFESENRTALLNSVFSDKIKELLFGELAECKNAIVFAEVPLLFEYGLEKEFDEVWVVEAKENERLNRVMVRDGLSKQAVLDRMARQTVLRRCDNCKILYNDGDLFRLYQQIDCLLLPFLTKYVKI